MTRGARAALLLLCLWPFAGEAARSAIGDGKRAHLTDEHRQFLEDVHWIITKEEESAFLELEKDYQRDAFIRPFLGVERDPPSGKTSAQRAERDATKGGFMK